MSFMSTLRIRRPPSRTRPSSGCPHRRLFVVTESLVALSGLLGTVQLVAGIATPPLEDLPLGLSSWVLPGVWLFATVTLPAAAAAWLAYRRSPLTPGAVLLAAATMAVEVLVQIPFLGPNPLQAVFGGLAVALGALGWHARRAGWGTRGAI
ncbi:MAG: hypothetical protein ACLGIF_06300 [Actinomycetes bacterium]